MDIKIDPKQIRELIALMEEHNLSNLELSNKDNAISLTRAGFSAPVAAAAPPQSAATATPSAAAPAGNVEESPMVGVFYSAPSPSDPPFVKVGQSVQKGDQLGIIEAMKIMNPIEASFDGVIAEILVNNGDVVQFGQPVIRYQS